MGLRHGRVELKRAGVLSTKAKMDKETTKLVKLFGKAPGADAKAPSSASLEEPIKTQVSALFPKILDRDLLEGL